MVKEHEKIDPAAAIALGNKYIKSQIFIRVIKETLHNHIICK
jgi:hypothetical protein